MILEPWNGSLLGTDLGLLSRGNRPGWPWYWNLGVKKVKLNYRRALLLQLGRYPLWYFRRGQTRLYSDRTQLLSDKMILKPWNGSLSGTDLGLLSWGNRPGWPWYWNLGVKQVQLNHSRALQWPCKLEAIASDTWSLYWLSGTDEMYPQEGKD